MNSDELRQVYEAWGIAPEEAESLAEADERAVPRVLFQLAVWDHVVDDAHVDGEPAWVEAWMRHPRRSRQQPRGVAAALARLLEAGVDPKDLTEVVRAMQIELVHGLCGLLDCEGLDDFDRAAPSATSGWRLFAIDVNRRPTTPIESLHEGIDDFDPLNTDGVRERKDRGL